MTILCGFRNQDLKWEGGETVKGSVVQSFVHDSIYQHRKTGPTSIGDDVQILREDWDERVV